MKIQFPEFSGLDCNMMPIIFGDDESVPEKYRGYLPLIQKCGFRSGDCVYLTVTEKVLDKGATSRRGGVHVDSPSPTKAWGGWGGGAARHSGIYIASTDGRTRIWHKDIPRLDIGHLGTCVGLGESRILSPLELAHIGDRTPHESLPALEAGPRQFFRLVGPKVSVWYARHNTPNPRVAPAAPITFINKFAA